MRDLCLLIGVVLTSIIFSLVRNDDLNVSLWTKCAAFKERDLVLNASLVHVLTGFDVIKSVGYDLSAAEELVREDFLGFLAYFVESSDDVAFEARVELK